MFKWNKKNQSTQVNYAYIHLAKRRRKADINIPSTACNHNCSSNCCQVCKKGSSDYSYNYKMRTCLKRNRQWTCSGSLAIWAERCPAAAFVRAPQTNTAPWDSNTPGQSQLDILVSHLFNKNLWYTSCFWWHINWETFMQ